MIQSIKSKKIKSFVLFAALIATLCVGSASVAHADTKNFTMAIPKYQGNNYTSAQNRSTDKPNNAWMVNMTKSDEKGGTVTTFWLVNTNNSKVSDKHDVWAGSGERTYASYKSGTKTNVKLAGENNTFNSEAYVVYGNWNQQTGKMVGE